MKAGFLSQFSLHFGKADDTPSSALSRVRSRILRLHHRRLKSGASSTFAQLGFNKQGFTFIGVFVFLVVTGIALTEATRYWSTVIRRDKEEELLFRGDQIKSAVESYYKNTPGGKKPMYPKSLEDLLKDPRYPVVFRHLRKIYRDPMTEDGMWGLIRDSKGKVKGVFSKSSLKPFKVGNFPDEYQDFEKAKTYADWKFVHTKKKSKKESKKTT